MRRLIVLLFWTIVGAGCHKEVNPDCVEVPVRYITCYLSYDPVCGCNGKTYGNACEAEAYSIRSYTQGACR